MIGKLKFVLYACMVAALLAACAGKDGDPDRQVVPEDKGATGEKGGTR